MSTKHTPKLPKQPTPKQSTNSTNISLSRFELADIKDVLQCYQDSIKDVAGVVSVLNYNTLHDHQQKALLNVLQAYCECILIDMADDTLLQISTALDKQGGDHEHQ